MLYLIIPPVIIIIATVILLFLLSRKGGEFVKKEKEAQMAGISQEGIFKKNKEEAYSRIKHYSLGLLEKATGLFKAILLRFHDLTSKWISIIKEKKSKYAAGMKKEAEEKKKEPVVEKPSFVTKIEAPIVKEIIMEEKKSLPMISKEIVQPETKNESKEEYEKILIERIAGNPRDLEAYERLGRYYLEQSSYQDAKECYKQVLKLSPVNRQARIKLKKITRILGH